ncbi:MAG: hypothetical protein CL833_06050 [Crocinitomicaceae bacterium]|nr:hypothetical protein [Crocinitomicaceae bacterium]|tara:strand:+ start:489 stop:689 length:201 start_codon:yes stop_codon:yes gene_type:complete
MNLKVKLSTNDLLTLLHSFIGQFEKIPVLKSEGFTISLLEVLILLVETQLERIIGIKRSVNIFIIS